MSAKTEMIPASLRPALPPAPPEWANLEKIAQECNLANLDAASGKFHRMILLARGIDQLRNAITPAMMREVMSLMDTSLGFRTDQAPGNYQNKPQYQMDVVKDVFIEATLRGFAPVGNEFNIIAGRFYGTKEGFTARLREWPGLTDLRIIPGIPKNVGEAGAVVTVKASWKLSGAPMTLERDFAIRLNKGMGADAILGKAERKMKAAIYSLLTGSEMSEGDASEFIEGEVVKDAKPAEAPVAAKGGEGTPPPPPASRADKLADSLKPNTTTPGPVTTPAPSDGGTDKSGDAGEQHAGASAPTGGAEITPIEDFPYPWKAADVIEWAIAKKPADWSIELATNRVNYILAARAVPGARKAWSAATKDEQYAAYVRWATNGFPWE